jgi:2-polyprenyl-3-methyl-5-hydroxy-6-metoxy-1,4-benzoquinol methylase
MDSHLVKNIATAALTVVAILVVARQCRKPMRWAGKPYLWLMNITHSGLTDWGLRHVVIEKPFTILDVGCGGGKTVAKLAALASEGKVYGIDYSSESVATSRRCPTRTAPSMSSPRSRRTTTGPTRSRTCGRSGGC